MFSKDERHKIENELNKSKENRNLENYTQNALNIWGQLTDLRNDINHASMRNQYFETDKAKKNIEVYSKKLVELVNSELI